MLRVLLASTFENSGGAARSASRLHRQLCADGVDSRMLVQFRESDDPSIVGPDNRMQGMINAVRPYLDALPVLWYRSRLSPPWGIAWLPKGIGAAIRLQNPDIIHLHWINFGFLSVGDIAAIDRPIVWTLHDSWPFTGGCNLPGDCRRYRESCGACPQLNSTREHDLSRWIWKRKAQSWKHLNLTVVAPSTWLAEAARSSSLFRGLPVAVIPNGIDLGRFQQGDKAAACRELRLPADKSLVLFGAANFNKDENKGFSSFRAALDILSSAGLHKRAEIVLFGADFDSSLLLEGFKVHCFGNIEDESTLIRLYSAADVFVLPSYQENLPNTVLEAMACGTPAVAFRIGGLPDIIDHCVNGYLCNPFSAEDLARGVSWVVSTSNADRDLGRAARKKVEQSFDLSRVAYRYRELYEKLVA